MRGQGDPAVPATLMARLSQSLETAVGLRFPSDKWRQLASSVADASSALGFNDVESCVRHLVSAPLTRSQIEAIAPHLTVGETYFLRDSACFAALEEDVLPNLIRSRRGHRQNMRIWSAGCATGEEAYSIAILLDRLIPDIADWKIDIAGTDINPTFLQRASAGRYGDWSFRGVPAWLKERYFRQTTDHRFEIHPRIGRMVTFSYFNLAEDNYPPAFTDTDVIFCRNVLMYFAPYVARKVVRRLHRALADGGWLVLSATDVSSELCAQFSAVAFPSATLYRKEPPAGEFLSSHRHPAVHQVMPAPPNVGMAPSPVQEVARPVVSDDPMPISSPAIDVAEVERRSPATAPHGPYKAALALYETGRYDEVVAKLTEMLAELPESDPAGHTGKAVALLARAYANQGQLAEALRCCERVVALDKLNPATHYLKATIFQELGREAEAVLSLRQALFLDHDFITAHFALGNLERQRGKSREAAKHFRNAQTLLKRCSPDAILPEAEGMTAGGLQAIIGSLLVMGAPG